MNSCKSAFRDFMKYVSFNILGQMVYSCYTLSDTFFVSASLGTDGTIFHMTNVYLKVMLLFAPAFLINNLLQCFVRNDGKPSLSMTAMISGSLSNVVLDYLFIFLFRMGIFGAILAMGFAPVISIAVLLPYFIRKKNGFHFVKSAPDIKRVLEIVSSGIPPFVTELSSGIVMFLFNFIILRLEGNIGVAAFGGTTDCLHF